jgi:hypothetical protein
MTQKISIGTFITLCVLFISLAIAYGEMEQFHGRKIVDLFMVAACVSFIYQFLYPEKRRKMYAIGSIVVSGVGIVFLLVHLFL